MDISVQSSLAPYGPALRSLNLPSYVISYPESGRLYWLSHLLKEERMSFTSLSEITGVSKAKIWYWFDSDDIRISQICDIAKAMGMKMVWKFSPATNDNNA